MQDMLREGAKLSEDEDHAANLRKIAGVCTECVCVCVCVCVCA